LVAASSLILGEPFTAEPAVADEAQLPLVHDPMAQAFVHGAPEAPTEAWTLAAGGRIYDNWWEALDRKEPKGTHPSYPQAGKQAGSATWRCKECHGWDYRGDRGNYGTGSHFTGIPGIPNQDIAMWVTMGPIADRTVDRLGASDLAVVEFRKQMVEAVRNFQQSSQAIGTGDDAIPATVCAFQSVIPKTTDWRQHDVRYVWPGSETTTTENDNGYLVKA
jgi:hypothetical protein